MKLHKGLLSFLSGLGWMGLAFYIWFFTFSEFKITSMFLYAVACAVLGAVVVYFVLIAFLVIPPMAKVSSTLAGFLAGILSMGAVIFMLLAWREGKELINRIHPIITFFIAAACTYLLMIPEEEKEEWKL